MSSKQQHPSPNWEHHVVTGKAKAQIRKFIRLQKHAQFLELGRSILHKALNKENYIYDEKTLTNGIKNSQLNGIDDIFIAIGEGTLGVKEVIKHLKPRESPITIEELIKLRPKKKSRIRYKCSY